MRTNFLICLPVPQELHSSLDRMKTFPSLSTMDNRCVLHLTVVVWSVSGHGSDRVDALKARLSRIGAGEFDLRFTGTEAFGESALVVTTDCPDELSKLRTASRSALRDIFSESFEEFDDHDYRPHVTVWRVSNENDSAGFAYEELPDSVWRVENFELWTKPEGGEYSSVGKFSLWKAARPSGLRKGSVEFVRRAILAVAQIWLFFTCFLPLGNMLGGAYEHVLKNGVSIPGFIDFAAFLAALSATAAIWATLKRRPVPRLAHGVTAFALACSVLLFAAEIRELSVCMDQESEEVYCFWIYEALLWSAGIMVGLLAIYFCIPEKPRK